MQKSLGSKSGIWNHCQRRLAVIPLMCICLSQCVVIYLSFCFHRWSNEHCHIRVTEYLHVQRCHIGVFSALVINQSIQSSLFCSIALAWPTGRQTTMVVLAIGIVQCSLSRSQTMLRWSRMYTFWDVWERDKLETQFARSQTYIAARIRLYYTECADPASCQGCGSHPIRSLHRDDFEAYFIALYKYRCSKTDVVVVRLLCHLHTMKVCKKASVSLRTVFITSACAAVLLLYWAPQYRKAPKLNGKLLI